MKNSNKAKWLYKKGYMPIIRKMSGHKARKVEREVCKEFGVKPMSKAAIQKYDSWNDERVAAYWEKKSWKRNSKRSHQYKD